MLLPLISLLWFGLTIASPHPEELHKSVEREDIASRTNTPTMMHKGGKSYTSDLSQGYHHLMRRSDDHDDDDDEENFDNLLRHRPADFILRPLQMLDFSRNMVGFMARSEDEHENVGKSIIERIMGFGNTMRDNIRDSFEQHDRYRRGAKGGGDSSSSSPPYPVYYQYAQPEYITPYIPPPQNSYTNRRCYLLPSPTHGGGNGRSSKRGKRSTNRNRNGDGESNQVLICEIPEPSCQCPPQKQPVCEETVDDVQEVKVTITDEYQNGNNGNHKYEDKPSNGHSNNHNNNNNNNNKGYSNNGNNAIPFSPFEMPESNGEGELMFSRIK